MLTTINKFIFKLHIASQLVWICSVRIMRGCYMWVLLCLILIVCVVEVKSQRSSGSTCLRNEVPCDNSECVARDVWCDGDVDCMDRSDEQYCKTKSWFDSSSVNDCTEKHFECEIGPCVPIATKCDGFIDCKGGSDEKYCDDIFGEFASNENAYTDEKRPSSQMYFDIMTAETIPFETFQTTSLPTLSNESVDSLSNIPERVHRAQQWILEQKDECHGWGEDTPRVLIALALISDDYLFDHPQIDLMKNNLASHLSIKFMQMWHKPPISNIGELALYINGLIATCQDPKQFWGHDLTAYLSESYEEPFYPLVLLTMCLTNNSVDIRSLIKLQNFISRLADKIPKQTDLQLLSMLSLLCYRERPAWNAQLEHKVVKAFRILDKSRRNDGSFGNIYTTALAAQVYMHRTKRHADVSQDFQKTVEYLIRHQKEDGSFGSMLATYYILPVLKGRSLLDLRNIRCDSIPKHDILPQNGTVSFSLLIFGNRRVKSKVIFISYEGKKTFFDIMQMAASMDSIYRFQYEETNFGKTVYSIAGIQNDVETRMSWSLYSQNLQEVMLKNALPMTLLGVGVDRIFADDGFAYTFLYSRD